MHRKTTITLASATACLAAATTVLAALPAGAAAKLKPPLVTENFGTPQKCDANTTVGQGACGERKVLAADKVLNEDITVVFKLLSSNTAQKDFITAEDDWVNYRKADCFSQSDVYLGGTEQGVVYIYCLATQDSARRADLKAMYKLFSQGMSKAPKFP